MCRFSRLAKFAQYQQLISLLAAHDMLVSFCLGVWRCLQLSCKIAASTTEAEQQLWHASVQPGPISSTDVIIYMLAS